MRNVNNLVLLVMISLMLRDAANPTKLGFILCAFNAFFHVLTNAIDLCGFLRRKNSNYTIMSVVLILLETLCWLWKAKVLYDFNNGNTQEIETGKFWIIDLVQLVTFLITLVASFIRKDMVDTHLAGYVNSPIFVISYLRMMIVFRLIGVISGVSFFILLMPFSIFFAIATLWTAMSIAFLFLCYILICGWVNDKKRSQ